MANKSLDADTQHQAAASRRMLRAGQLRRYRSNVVSNVFAIEPRAVGAAFSVSASALSRSRRFAQAASLFWGAGPGARAVGTPAWSHSGYSPIQPHTCRHRGGKLRFGASPSLALAGAASDNKSVQTDRVTAGCACLRASADLQR